MLPSSSCAVITTGEKSKMKSQPLSFVCCLRFFALALALALGAGPRPAAAQNAQIVQDARTLTANEPDGGLTAVEVEGHVGRLQILPGASGGIRVRVDVKRSMSNGRVR